MRVSQMTAMLAGAGPIYLCFAPLSGNYSLFFHYWVICVVFFMVTSFVSLVISMLID